MPLCYQWYGGAVQRTIRHLLQPYIKNQQVFACPSHMAFNWNSNGGQSYQFNRRTDDYLYGVFSSYQNRLGLASFSHPAETVIVFDGGGCQVSHHAKIITRDARPAAEVPAERHNDGANWGFLDGHAKWMRIEQTLSPVNMYRISRG